MDIDTINQSNFTDSSSTPLPIFKGGKSLLGKTSENFSVEESDISVDSGVTDSSTPLPLFKGGKSLFRKSSENFPVKKNEISADSSFKSHNKENISSDIIPSFPIQNKKNQDRNIILSNGKEIILRRKKKNSLLNFKSNQKLPSIQHALPLPKLPPSLPKINTNSDNSNSNSNSKDKNRSILWTENYRPKKYIDLIGDDKSHRRVLKWLKLWSQLVFGKIINFSKFDKSRSISKSKSNFIQQETIIDVLGRPDKKIILLSGPPGIGKTTIAHVSAKQAGFNVLEINASDERGGVNVKDKIINAVMSHSYNGKPTCVILDEIDGATDGGFIKVLVDLVNQDNKAINQLKLLNDKEKSSSKIIKKIIKRPIIAICNDLYSSQLEKLRPLCEILKIEKINKNSIISRLSSICINENLSLSNKDLNDIVEINECDLRSCLNFLQFGGGESIINKEGLFSRDGMSSWFTVVNHVFKRDWKSTKKIEFDKLNRILETSTQFNKIITKCFATYANSRYQDDLFSKPMILGDWLYFYDIINKQVYTEQHGEMVAYLPQVILSFFNLFNDLGNNENLKIDNTYEIQEKEKQTKDQCRKLLLSTSISLRQIFKLSTISLELAPYLFKILKPQVNIVKLNNEKCWDFLKLKKSSQIIDDLNIQIFLEKQKSYENGYIGTGEVAKMIPRIDLITIFGVKEERLSSQKMAILLPYINGQLEKLRIDKHKRSFGTFENGQEKMFTVSKKKSGKKHKSKSIKDKDKNENENEDSPQKKPMKNKIWFAKNDSTRMIGKAGSESQSINGRMDDIQRNKLRIWVRYNEGFSNAVRKNITWKELWD